MDAMWQGLLLLLGTLQFGSSFLTMSLLVVWKSL